VYFILGCTACGKGAVGRELARELQAEIVSVDSMKVYRGMDIGTAKPSARVRGEIPHHCIDVVDPTESYSVAQFVEHADAAVADIRSRGRVPLAVGGTSLYIKALSKGLFEGPSADEQLRQELRGRARREGLAVLHAELSSVDPAAAERIHPNDERRIIRALEVYRLSGTPITELQTQWESQGLRYDCVFIGLRREKELQSRRINARAKKMMDLGLPDEVAGLLGRHGQLSQQAAKAVGYAEMIRHLRGDWTLDEAFERIKINTRRLAKSQRTWQKRWRDVRWFDLADHETPEQTVLRIREEVDFT
jgi:tRNA dimethylallyltransferase